MEKSNMSKSGDNFVRNHFVTQTDPSYMLESSKAIKIQFTRTEKLPDGVKYIRATVNASHEIMMEIFEKYGLADVIASRWEVWQAPTKEQLEKNPNAKGKNVPFLTS